MIVTRHLPLSSLAAPDFKELHGLKIYKYKKFQ